MNFWTFLDRNIVAIGWGTFMLLFGGALIVHESKGCTARVGSTEFSIGSPDAGAP